MIFTENLSNFDSRYFRQLKNIKRPKEDLFLIISFLYFFGKFIESVKNMVVLLLKHCFIDLYTNLEDTVLTILEILLIVLQIFNLKKFLYCYPRVERSWSEAKKFNEYLGLIFFIVFNLSFANPAYPINSELGSIELLFTLIFEL